eukprot:CAMPEP_0179983118 /NCGR_PEP_ID=MMETSP0984-20121128/363_1 /TAXON_ID=483367 /ORGANISM="non described non described, Strain CCMP 2436" /LENGTH=356 /DNA_ID=CAMNT_0021901485 /DNA_START=67 /DNA_END=1136 /DNA_ORIENTATION=+
MKFVMIHGDVKGKPGVARRNEPEPLARLGRVADQPVCFLHPSINRVRAGCARQRERGEDGCGGGDRRSKQCALHWPEDRHGQIPAEEPECKVSVDQPRMDSAHALRTRGKPPLQLWRQASQCPLRSLVRLVGVILSGPTTVGGEQLGLARAIAPKMGDGAEEQDAPVVCEPRPQLAAERIMPDKVRSPLLFESVCCQMVRSGHNARVGNNQVDASSAQLSTKGADAGGRGQVELQHLHAHVAARRPVHVLRRHPALLDRAHRHHDMHAALGEELRDGQPVTALAPVTTASRLGLTRSQLASAPSKAGEGEAAHRERAQLVRAAAQRVGEPPPRVHCRRRREQRQKREQCESLQGRG